MTAGHSIDAARWRAMFDQAMARLAGRFRRVEPRAAARAFVLGLLSGVERKNCWRLAERACHARPGSMQRLLCPALKLVQARVAGSLHRRGRGHYLRRRFFWLRFVLLTGEVGVSAV